MSMPLVNIARLSLVFAVAGLVLAGCGRKGDLDRPSTPVEQQNIRKSSNSEDRKEPVVDRPFLLDPLL